MKAQHLDIFAFRNIKNAEISPVPGVNVICGENGQGKTNLLEALWLFTGSRSFRGAKESELVPIGGEFAKISLSFYAFCRDMQCEIRYGRVRGASLNGVDEKSAAALSGNLFAVVFSPTHLSLVKGAPAERRQALDTMIEQLKPRYKQVLGEYGRLLQQRNTLLRDAQLSPALIDTLDVWDASIAKIGALVTRTRKSYLERIAPIAGELYAGISGGREVLELSYEASAEIGGNITEEEFLALLRQNRNEDMRTGITSVGPQRDDFSFFLDGVSAKAYASQGQQRSAVLALKLAECTLIEQVSGEAPLVLLDDVMSELDANRRDYLLHHLENRQIFITCCDPHQIESAEAIWEVSNGNVRQVKQ